MTNTFLFFYVEEEISIYRKSCRVKFLKLKKKKRKGNRDTFGSYKYISVGFVFFFLDLWLRTRPSGGVRRVTPHDSGSRNPVLPSSRDPDGEPSLPQLHRYLVCGLHLCWAAGQTDPLSGPKSNPAGRVSVSSGTPPFTHSSVHPQQPQHTLLNNRWRQPLPHRLKTSSWMLVSDRNNRC